MTNARLEKRIGYSFKRPQLLAVALTHSSYANESKGRILQSNERLEFLGDAVLSLTVTNFLYTRFTELPEGELTKVRAFLVCETSLSDWARQIELGSFLLLGKGEEMANGRDRPSILADAFEALLGAMYLDGGPKPVREFLVPFVEAAVQEILKGKNALKDYKTSLQEIVQKNKEETLEYRLVDESGPDHAKEFVIEVLLNSNPIGVGRGRSKKEAEQNAARQALELMGQI